MAASFARARSPVALLAGAAAIVVVVFALLGGEPEPLSGDEYRMELMEAIDGFEVAAATDSQSLEGLAEEFRSAADELEGMQPPADAVNAHARLVAGLGSYGDKLAEFAESGRSGAVQHALELAEHQLSGEQWVAAMNDLAAKGYLTYPAP
jgi:hypothetical protein